MNSTKLLVVLLSLAASIPRVAMADLGVEPVIPGGRDAPAAKKADWCQGFVRGQKLDPSTEPRQRGVTDNLGSVAWFACEQDSRWTRAEEAREKYLTAFPGLTAHDFSEVMAAYRDIDKAKARDERMCEKLKKAATDLDGRVRHAISCDWRQLEAKTPLAIELDRPGDTGSIAVRIARRYACHEELGSSNFSAIDGRCPDEVAPVSRDELERDLGSRPLLQRIDMREVWSRGNQYGVESKARIAKARKELQGVAAARTAAARAWADAYAANPGPIDEAFSVFAKLRAGKETDAIKGCSATMVPAFTAYVKTIDTTTEAFIRGITAPAGALVWNAAYACALVDDLPLATAMMVTRGYGTLGKAKGGKGRDDLNPFRRLAEPAGPRFDLRSDGIGRLEKDYRSPDISEGVIAAIKKGKKGVTLTFKKEKISVPETTMAVGDIDGIDSDGRFTRSMYFKYTGRMLTQDVTAKPFTVTAAVAKSLKPGMYLRMAIITEQNVVMVAYTNTKAKDLVMFANTPTR